MRRGSRVTGICATLISLFLVGCSADGPDAPPDGGQPSIAGPSPSTADPQPAPLVDPDADAAALAEVTLTGNLGTMPFFNVAPQLTLTGEVARVADEGSGRAVEAGHAVAVHVASFGVASDAIEASTYEQGPELLLVDEGSLPSPLFDALVTARVGSRVLFGAPIDGDTKIYSFEVVGTGPVFDRAEGAAVSPPADMPVITLTDGGEPTMKPAGGDPPGSLAVQTLIKGDGDQIRADSWLVVHYSTWLWDGTEVESTWMDDQRMVVRMADAIIGWQEGLAGQTIGSQVLLVVPPDKAFGTEATERVPSGSTVVIVIDILAGM